MSKDIQTINIKLKNYIHQTFANKNYKNCIKAICLYGQFMYTTNQEYMDKDVENILYNIAASIHKGHEKKQTKKTINKYILFYDSFGLELRGLALIYIKALVRMKVNIIYVTCNKRKNSISNILNEIQKNENNKIYFVKESPFIKEHFRLLDYLSKFDVNKVILYLTPNDIMGIFLGYWYEKQCNRYLINLTDHAFWLGTNAFDYIIEFRDYGASVSKYYRNIDKDKIIKIPYYPLIIKDIPFEGFPVLENTNKIVFSGGSLYKTIGDNNKYYKCIITHILENHLDTVFIYAGFGNNSEIKKLQSKFPQRVFHLPERNDLFQMMKHSYLYISTYPMPGGLMTHYAVAAGTVPLTLLFDECGTGILLHPEDAKLDYIDVSTYLGEIDRCLNDEEYLNSKKRYLSNQIISKEVFEKEVMLVIENCKSTLSISYNKIDTTRFRQWYKECFTINDWYNMVGNPKYYIFIKMFAKDWIIGILKKVRRKLCR